MGKTLTSVLSIGAALAVSFVPGVGQAIGMAVFQAGVGAGVGMGFAATLANAVLAGIVVTGLSSAVGVLGLGPSMPKPETTETAIKTSRPERISAYGISRLYGAYCLYETAANGTAVDVYAVHDGALTSIDAYYLGDDQVTLTGSVVNQGGDGRYKGSVVNVYSTSGAAPGAGFPALASLMPGIWTSDHRGDGVVALALTARQVKAKEFQETYPQSMVPIPSIVAKWQACPDPSAEDPLNESGWTWTQNPARHLLHYMLVREGPKPALPRSSPGYPAALAALRSDWWARKIAPTLQYWIDAAAHCDDPVNLKTGGTEPRYRSCLSHKHTTKHEIVKQALLATFDGWTTTRPDGAIIIYSGRYYAPTVSIGPDQIISYTWEGGKRDEDQALNEIVCSYVSALHDYNTVECDPWRDEPDITARGQVLSTTLEVQIPSHGQARRLAKRAMLRTNSIHRGTVTTNNDGRIVRGERYINLHIEEAGTVFFSGPVEISALTRNVTGGVTFTWVAIQPSIDAWNPATEEGDPAPVGTRIATAPLDAPTITTVTIIDGPRLLIEGAGPDRDDLTWFARVREVGSGWGTDLEYSDVAPGASVEITTDILPSDASLEVQIAYQVGDGRLSPFSATAPVDMTTVPPPQPGSFIVTGGAGEADAAWINPVAANFFAVRLYRHTADDFGAAAPVVILPQPLGGAGAYKDDGLSAGTYYYWLTSRTSGGVESAPVASGAVTVT